MKPPPCVIEKWTGGSLTQRRKVPWLSFGQSKLVKKCNYNYNFAILCNKIWLDYNSIVTLSSTHCDDTRMFLGVRSYYMVGSYLHHVITCLVLKAGSSSWQEFFWKLRVPNEPFTKKSSRKNLDAFNDLKKKLIIEMWNVRFNISVRPMT